MQGCKEEKESGGTLQIGSTKFVERNQKNERYGRT